MYSGTVHGRFGSQPGPWGESLASSPPITSNRPPARGAREGSSAAGARPSGGAEPAAESPAARRQRLMFCSACRHLFEVGQAPSGRCPNCGAEVDLS